MNEGIKQVTRDAETDSGAQCLGRVNKAIPQLHLAGVLDVLLPITLSPFRKKKRLGGIGLPCRADIDCTREKIHRVT